MRSLLLDPHGDDGVLFASWILLRERPHVIVTNQTVPLDEIDAVMHFYGCSWHAWPEGDYDQMRTWLSSWLPSGTHEKPAERVFAPAVEVNGHGQHSLIGELALEVFGAKRVVHYLTYAPRGQRSRGGTEAEPDDPVWIARKLHALACFESQIAQESTRPWFYELLDMREWVA